MQGDTAVNSKHVAFELFFTRMLTLLAASIGSDVSQFDWRSRYTASLVTRVNNQLTRAGQAILVEEE